MSTFLQLSQSVAQECGVTGTLSSVTAPPSNGWQNIVNWTIQSWVDIQEIRPDWQWMRKPVSFQTVVNQQSYSPTTDALLTDFAAWKNDSFRLYLTASGVKNETFLFPEEYSDFRDSYILGARRTSYARPISLTVDPSKNILLGLAPDQVYTVVGEYYKTPVFMSLDADVPDMPVRFHKAIVYGAMIKYGFNQSAGEVIQYASAMYDKYIKQLQLDQLPMITMASPLA